MPFASEKQRKAMYAAASGKSNIGIPKSVGEKFIKHAKDEADLNLWLLELFAKEVAEKQAKKDTKQAPALLTPPQKWKKHEYDDSEAWETKEGKNKNGGLWTLSIEPSKGYDLWELVSMFLITEDNPNYELFNGITCELMCSST